MPSDIQRAQNYTTEAIVTIFGRLGLWEVPHLENVYSLHSHLICIKSAYVKKNKLFCLTGTICRFICVVVGQSSMGLWVNNLKFND